MQTISDFAAHADGYELVFDVCRSGYRHWPYPLLFLFFLAVGVGQLLRERRRPLNERRKGALVFGYVFSAVALGMMTATFAFTFGDYRRLCEALQSGSFEVVEGTITNFVPMNPFGPGFERLEVGARCYAYSDYHVTAGFNNTRSHGGPLHDGVAVRIADVDGEIARLEVKP